MSTQPQLPRLNSINTIKSLMLAFKGFFNFLIALIGEHECFKSSCYILNKLLFSCHFDVCLSDKPLLCEAAATFVLCARMTLQAPKDMLITELESGIFFLIPLTCPLGWELALEQLSSKQ